MIDGQSQDRPECTRQALSRAGAPSWPQTGGGGGIAAVCAEEFLGMILLLEMKILSKLRK